MSTGFTKYYQRALRHGTSITVIGLAIFSASPARAECDDNTPNSGVTVTCDANGDNPDPDGVRNGTAADVAVNILTDADIRTDGLLQDGIRLGDGARINMGAGSSILTTADGSYGIRVGNNAIVDLDNASVTAEGGFGRSGSAAIPSALTVGENADIRLRNGSVVTAFNNAIELGDNSSVLVGENSQIITTGGADLTGERGVAIDGGRFPADGVTVDMRLGSLISVQGNGGGAMFLGDDAMITIDGGAIDIVQDFTGLGSRNGILGGIQVRDDATISLTDATITTFDQIAISAIDNLTLDIGDGTVISAENPVGGQGFIEFLDNANITMQSGSLVRVVGTSAFANARSVNDDRGGRLSRGLSFILEEGARIEQSGVGFAIDAASNADITIDGEIEARSGVSVRQLEAGTVNIDVSGSIVAQDNAILISDNYFDGAVTGDRFGFINVAEGARVISSDFHAIQHSQGNDSEDFRDPAINPWMELTVTIAGEVRSERENGFAFRGSSGNDIIVLLPTAQISGTLAGSFFVGERSEDTDQIFFNGVAGTNGLLDLGVSPIALFEELIKEGEGTWTIRGTSLAADSFTEDRDDGPIINVIALENNPVFDIREGTMIFDDIDLDTVAVTIRPGAFLEGFGTFGSLDVQGQATISPTGANGGPGLFEIGDLTLTDQAVFVVDANDQGEADRINVTGTVTLGGATLNVRDMAGGNFDGTDPFNYIIIGNDAADAINGTFGAITNELAFLTPTVSYSGGDGNDVVLTLTPNNVTPPPPPPPPPPTPPPPPPPTGGTGPDPIPGGLFQTAALTFNQLNSANRLDRLDQTAGTDAADIYTQILFMDAVSARDAFDQASGEVYATLQADGAERAMMATGRLTARAHEQSGTGWGIWGGVGGRAGTVDEDGNAADVNNDSLRFDLGMDYRGPDNKWAFGAAVGYFRGGLEIDHRNSNLMYNGWSIGGYGRYGSGNTGPTVTGAVSYGDGEADVVREVAFGTIARVARATVDIETIGLAGEIRYGFPVGSNWAAGPVASISYVDADLGRYSETGAESLNLSGSGDADSITRYGAGVFANWQAAGGNFDVSAQYVDRRSRFSQVSMALEGAPAELFPVRSPRTNGSAALISAGGRYDLGNGWAIGGDLRGLFGGDERAVTGSIVLGWRF
ncbi:autotransporter outer membrane beta-barrel domain-containing protein [Pontixanthobacter aquaemixtae]|uniref:Autotransporter domain-containing protein n=1 Tax=Pontixanthobacter aquaemixtae TaxID=1958940 RepID=A0A844ZTV0_9SPHN|nr:autotransporter outer membrane beta-barrel domain-containing protein [Pontixanthobacter aquaemixtae]MXO90894.1 autotransporter domain-containing protein [Pontixanthobacter aquaemixtae]